MDSAASINKMTGARSYALIETFMKRMIRYRFAPVYALLLTIGLYLAIQPLAGSDSDVEKDTGET